MKELNKDVIFLMSLFLLSTALQILLVHSHDIICNIIGDKAKKY